MSECIFCQIAQHQIKSKIEYEDKEIIAFFDIRPAAKIHILIVPKKHLASLNEATEKDAPLLGKMVLLAQKLAKKYQTDKKGYKLVVNTGPWSGQTVSHLHLHLLGGEPLTSAKILKI